MYRIHYIQGNGYKCSCCRHTWENTTDVATREEVYEILNNIIDAKESPDAEINDIALIDVIEFKDVTLSMEAVCYDQRAAKESDGTQNG